MLPGPNQVYECPLCKKLLFRRSLMSGNTFGAEVFSDGKRIAPMLPEYPNLTKCPECNSMFWLSNLEEIGSFSSRESRVNSEWEKAIEVEFLTIYEYQLAIEKKVFTTKGEESFIRQRIWWGFNDRIRDGNPIFSSSEDVLLWTSNAYRLIELLDIEELNHKIMIAELHRNLEDFNACMEIINSIEDPQLDFVKNAFERECLKKNAEVFQLY